MLRLWLLRLRVRARVEHECAPFRLGRLLIGAGPRERQRHEEKGDEEVAA